MTQQQSHRAQARSRWAPWWAYLVGILGVNYLRQLIMPVGTLPEWGVVLVVLAISVVLFVVITAIHRAIGRE